MDARGEQQKTWLEELIRRPIEMLPPGGVQRYEVEIDEDGDWVDGVCRSVTVVVDSVLISEE